ncbi:MAG: hypothetical protein ABI697_00210 [Devosia sp.]
MAALPDALPASLTVTTWNLGYAGLGAESDFIADGGRHRFPPSAAIVRKNLDGIVATLSGLEQQVLLLQEVSRHSPLSWWQPVEQRLARLYAERSIAYRPDMQTRWLPAPLAVNHGTMLVAEVAPLRVETVELPRETAAPLGMPKRQYGLQVLRAPLAGSTAHWVIANVHLSAFDDGGRFRRRQLAAVFDFAEAEYRKGNHVIVGGDWNMVLSDPKWPSTTEQKHLFWIFDFPRDLVPAGWSLVTDATMPTVRTLHKPYVAGENYVTAIDGFLVSPNVRTLAAHTSDTGFAFSDHMPVTASFEAA